MNMNLFTYLDTDEKVVSYIESLNDRKIEIIAVDLEGEYNLHQYGEHLCLVQIYDGEEAVIIDPQKISLNLIKDFFENREISKIFYDCTGDRTLLFRKYDISVFSIVDLFPAVELLPFQKKNLNFILNQTIGLEVKPKKKFQRYNWMRRPIDKEALLYAIDDVKYLFLLKDNLMKQLENKGLISEYKKKNEAIVNKPVSMIFTPGVFKKDQYKNLNKKNREILKSLFTKRDEYAKQLNLPPNSVVANTDLFHLSTFKLRAENIPFLNRINRKTISDIKRDFAEILLLRYDLPGQITQQPDD